MAQRTYAQANSGDAADFSVHRPWTLQLLWGEWELSCHTELLEVSEILHLPRVESPASEAILEV